MDVRKDTFLSKDILERFRESLQGLDHASKMAHFHLSPYVTERHVIIERYLTWRELNKDLPVMDVMSFACTQTWPAVCLVYFSFDLRNWWDHLPDASPEGVRSSSSLETSKSMAVVLRFLRELHEESLSLFFWVDVLGEHISTSHPNQLPELLKPMICTDTISLVQSYHCIPTTINILFDYLSSHQTKRLIEWFQHRGGMWRNW